jgi:hypothetical protein
MRFCSSGMFRQRWWVVSYRRFGKPYRSPIQESSSQRSSFDFVTLEDETDRLSQTVGKYQATLHNISEERRSQANTSYTITPTNTNTVLNNKSRSFPKSRYFLLLLLLLLLLLWRCNSDRVLAFSTISFHLRRSWTFSVHFISLIFFKSFLMSSSHLDLGLPTGLLVNGFHFYIFFTVLFFRHSIYVSKPAQSLSFNIIDYVPVFY